MFNVYKNQLSRQTGSRNLTGPKTLPTIWGTYMKLVTKYQISAINSYREKCDEKYLGRTEVKQYTPLPLCPEIALKYFFEKMWFYMKYIVKNRGWRILVSMYCTSYFCCLVEYLTVNLFELIFFSAEVNC